MFFAIGALIPILLWALGLEVWTLRWFVASAALVLLINAAIAAA